MTEHETKIEGVDQDISAEATSAPEKVTGAAMAASGRIAVGSAVGPSPYLRNAISAENARKSASTKVSHSKPGGSNSPKASLKAAGTN